MNVTGVFVQYTTDDPDRMFAFYRDIVGLAPNPEMGVHTVMAGTVALGFDTHSATKGPVKEPSRMMIDLFVDDLAGEEARMEAAGVKFIRKQGREEWGGVISTFIDPDGNYGQIIGFNPGAPA
jgi:predicted enzyme related to lactoylglutathione lyase